MLSRHQLVRHGPLVLVASGEPMVANFLRRHLHGYQVKRVVDEDLPYAVATYLPHAVICPLDDDRAQHQGKAAAHPNPAPASDAVPIIACPLPDPSRIAHALGVDRYLIKPVDRLHLLELLEAYGDKVRTIHLIDDDLQYCQLIARIIRSAPRAYRVHIACGGAEGLERLRQARPDLLLLDYLMPDLNGVEVLQLVRADPHLQDLPVVMMTAHDLPEGDFDWTTPSRLQVENMQSFSTRTVIDLVQALLDAFPPPKPAHVLAPAPAPVHPQPPAS
jgi:CheY-like chemotaxis protein